MILLTQTSQQVDAEQENTQKMINKSDEYKKFSEWCSKNKVLDLDPRLHTHSGDINHGGYISHEKTSIAFKAWLGRAGEDGKAPPLISPQCKHELTDKEEQKK